MSKFLIIPKMDHIEETLALCEEYDLGFELNEFMFPKVLITKLI